MLELFYSLLGMIIQFSVGAFRTNFDLFSIVVKNNDVIIWGVGIITNAVNVIQRLTLEQNAQCSNMIYWCYWAPYLHIKEFSFHCFEKYLIWVLSVVVFLCVLNPFHFSGKPFSASEIRTRGECCKTLFTGNTDLDACTLAKCKAMFFSIKRIVLNCWLLLKANSCCIT